MSKVNPIPEGFTSVTPHLVIKNAGKAIDFYTKAFGATELFRMPGPDGGIMHAEIQIGNARIMIGEENPQWDCKGPTMLGGSPVTIHLYVKDADATFEKAVAAGATGAMPPADMPWGDRYGKVIDPFGHHWSIATHVEDLAPDEIGRRMAEMMAKSCA